MPATKRLKLVEKTVAATHRPDAAPLCGFVTYAHPAKPLLLRRRGWEIANDIHDEFSDQTSTDNGATWSEPRPALAKKKVDGGYICHTENAIQLLPDGRLVHFTNDKFESSLEGCDLDGKCAIRVTVGTADEISSRSGKVLASDFGAPAGLCVVSFLTPMVDSRGRILAPIQWPKRDIDGSIRKLGFPTRKDHPDMLQNVGEPGLLIGELQPGGDIKWRRTGPVPYDFFQTSRGLCEPTIAELSGGRLAMIMRGSNAQWPEKPGYKWLSVSEDGGESWSHAIPLPCTDGSLIESGASGSAFFRSIVDAKLYWIGNLCSDGTRANANMPRSPLHVLRMSEDPLAIERDSISVIDQVQVGEHPETQHSNFKFYQDRVTGEVVLYLTRYGERGYADGRWLHSDEYRYRFRAEDLCGGMSHAKENL